MLAQMFDARDGCAKLDINADEMGLAGMICTPVNDSHPRQTVQCLNRCRGVVAATASYGQAHCFAVQQEPPFAASATVPMAPRATQTAQRAMSGVGSTVCRRGCRHAAVSREPLPRGRRRCRHERPWDTVRAW